MKHIIILLLITATSSHPLTAQEALSGTTTIAEAVDTVNRSQRENEAILSLSYAYGGMSFGLIYKRQLGKRTYLRTGLVDFNSSLRNNEPTFTNQFPTKTRSVSGAVQLGLEFRFNLHPRIQTYTGVDLVAGGMFSIYMVDNPALPV